MRKLKVDLGQLGSCMQDVERLDSNYYLDTETGEILSIPDEVLGAVECGEADALSEWGQELVEHARKIIENRDRFRRVPEIPSYEVYNLMVRFAKGVEDEALGEKLAIALDGRGAFRRFKNVLSDYPDEREKWFETRDDHVEEQAREWLESLGVEPA